jgi:hypothetical protein
MNVDHDGKSIVNGALYGWGPWLLLDIQCSGVVRVAFIAVTVVAKIADGVAAIISCTHLKMSLKI